MDACNSHDKEALKNSIELYKGDLLSEKDYLWCYEMRSKLLEYYKNEALILFDIYFYENEYNRCVDLVEEILSHTDFDEDVISKLEKISELKLDRALSKRAKKIIKKVSLL